MYATRTKRSARPPGSVHLNARAISSSPGGREVACPTIGTVSGVGFGSGIWTGRVARIAREMGSVVTQQTTGDTVHNQGGRTVITFCIIPFELRTVS